LATLTKTPAGKWKSIIRKTFRTKRDASDWARNVEDDMVRGVFINRADSHHPTLKVAFDCYLSEITPTKRPTTAVREARRAKTLKERLGKCSLTALTPDVIAKYRDTRTKEGQSASSVRLDLALLSHLYTTAIREWRLALGGSQTLPTNWTPRVASVARRSSSWFEKVSFHSLWVNKRARFQTRR
jgi:hypothetical protein